MDTRNAKFGSMLKSEPKNWSLQRSGVEPESTYFQLDILPIEQPQLTSVYSSSLS